MKLFAILLGLSFIPVAVAERIPAAEFASPIIMSGDIELSFTGRILLIVEPRELVFSVDWPGSVSAFHENRLDLYSNNSLLRQREDTWLPIVDRWHGNDVRMDAWAHESVAAIQLWADEIRVFSKKANIRASSEDLDACWANLVDYDRARTRAWRVGTCQPGDVGWRLELGGPLRLSADGVEYLEMLGTQWSCSSRECPPAAPVVHANEDLVPTQHASARTFTHTVLEGDRRGTLTATSLAKTAYLATTIASVELEGIARLPQYRGPMADPAGNQTLRLEGSFAVTDLTGRPGGQFTAQLALPAVVFLDEVPLAGTRSTVVAAATVGLLALLAKLVVGLLTWGGASALRSPRRRKLMTYIERNPGATFRELVRGTEIPAGTARHHVAVLKHANLIMEKPHNQTLRYFENHGKFVDSWNSVVLLREPELNALHSWLRGQEAATQKDIIAWAEAQGWSRSTAQHRIKRLEAEGLVSVRPRGRWKCYTAHRRAPVPN